MKVLVSCNLDDFKTNCIENKVFEKGSDTLYYNIEVSTEEELKEAESFRNNERVMCITALDIDLNGNCFKEITLDDVDNLSFAPSNTLCRLPDGFSDMKRVDDIRRKLNGIRFIGGNLLELPDLKIGRYDEGKEKLGSVFNGIYDTFLEVRAEDIDNLEEIKGNLNPYMLNDILEIKVKTSKKKVVNRSINSGEKKEKPKKVKAAAQSFGSLFGGEDVGF